MWILTFSNLALPFHFTCMKLYLDNEILSVVSVCISTFDLIELKDKYTLPNFDMSIQIHFLSVANFHLYKVSKQGTLELCSSLYSCWRTDV